MARDASRELAGSDRACLVAPAGFGKTEVVAKAVALHSEGPQLVLTHTHAGVRALRERLARFGAAPRAFHLDTIAGFALRYAAGFPRTSGIDTTQPTGSDWDSVYSGADKVLSTRIGSSVVRDSFEGVFVDEYQDCTPAQHSLVTRLTELLPVRVVGDPLQGIFEFGGGVVDWDVDVFTVFNQLDELEEPWRWRLTNPQLGDWLTELRNNLLTGVKTDLSGAPLTWKNSTHPAEKLACCHAAGQSHGSVVAIHQWAQQCHTLAGKLGGVFSSMEEVESRDLLKYAQKLEAATAAERVDVLLDFASKCMTGISADFGSVRKTIKGGGKPRMPPSTSMKREVVRALLSILEDDELTRIEPAMKAIRHASSGNLYREELWTEMQRALDVFHSETEHESLANAAWAVRDRGRHHGRRIPPKIVSRTLLIKGLEFDHSIVLDASELDEKNLYVAMTRGSSQLTVLSESATV